MLMYFDYHFAFSFGAIRYTAVVYCTLFMPSRIIHPDANLIDDLVKLENRYVCTYYNAG